MTGSTPTCRHNCFHACPIDECPLDGLCADIRPVDPLLHGVIVNYSDVVNVGNSEGVDVVVVWVVNVNPADLHLAGIEQELLKLWRRGQRPRMHNGNSLQSGLSR